MKRSKRALAALLAVLMAASSAPFAMASDTLPYLGESARGENQPYQHGYRAEDLLDWSPETDPWGDMLRAEVPLQDRNAALAATQANPDLSPETQWFTLAGDYGNAFFGQLSLHQRVQPVSVQLLAVYRLLRLLARDAHRGSAGKYVPG